MDNNTVTILNEEFENDKTGEKVQGITIIVDGKLKEVLDLLMKNNPDYKIIQKLFGMLFLMALIQ